MAKMLYDKMSTDGHLDSSKRHTRLCKRIKGAENLVTAITPSITNLKEKQEIRLACEDDKTAAYDDMQFNDAALDDVIRNLSAGTKQYDRAHPGRSVHSMLFPDGKTTTITEASLSAEPDKAEQVLQRLKGFEEGHELLSYQLPLESAIAICRSGISSYQNSITAVKTALAEEEMAQAALRRQYEFNYLDAVKIFGKSFAHRLFPKAASKKKEVIAEAVPE
ncbi:hypothetical protein [Labilibaculum antarcticum]|uniref:Uncharacterized protein n=1 Tax=Labilibaculum antarcticum TaxID=1717717 RepID=A0A1Y1CEG9_9BACT|nr:hypothetical protein [Labilibaculum antarcticum]BAX78422.1 hypothetical protein ALGA_0027 [Labilibaculum antarcticum]